MFLLFCMPFINTRSVSFHPDILCLFVVFFLLLCLLLSPQTLTRTAAADIVRQRQPIGIPPPWIGGKKLASLKATLGRNYDRPSHLLTGNRHSSNLNRRQKDAFAPFLSVGNLIRLFADTQELSIDFNPPAPLTWIPKWKLTNMNSVLSAMSQYLAAKQDCWAKIVLYGMVRGFVRYIPSWISEEVRNIKPCLEPKGADSCPGLVSSQKNTSL